MTISHCRPLSAAPKIRNYIYTDRPKMPRSDDELAKN